MKLPTPKTVEKMSERARSKSTRAVTALVTNYKEGEVTARSIDGAILTARCDFPVRPGGVVLIGTEPHAPNQLRVLDVRHAGGTGGVIPHGHTHTMGGEDPVPVWFSQVADWNIEPDGLALKLWRGAAQTTSGYQLPGEVTVDLSPHVPASGARYALIYLTASGAIAVQAGTVKASVSALTPADIPARPPNTAPLWAVLLYANQSQIIITKYRTDVIDLRLATALSPVSGGSGVTLPASRVIATDTAGQPVNDSPVWGADGQIRWSDVPGFVFPAASLLGWQIAAETTTPGMSLIRASSDNAAGAINFVKYGGTLTSPSAVLAGWRLGSFSFGGHYGSGIDSVKARISANASQNWSDPNRGAKIIISATPNNTKTMQDVAEFGGDRIDFLQPAYAPNIAYADGWRPYSAITPTRTGADDPTYTIQFAGVDLREMLYEGMPIRWRQNSIMRYGWISSAPTYSGGNTLMTVLTRTDSASADYDVLDTNAYPISNFGYGLPKQPGAGMSVNPDHWDVIVTDTTTYTKTSPTQNTWYNAMDVGSLPSIVAPIGLWESVYFALGRNITNTSLFLRTEIALSTSTSSVSDASLVSAASFNAGYDGSGNLVFVGGYSNFPKILSISTKATYYLIIRTMSISSSVMVQGASSPTVLRMRNKYL